MNCCHHHANKTHFPEHMLDYNIRAERAGWLPSAPQLNRNPLTIANEAKAKGMKVEDYVVESLQNGSLSFACESPDNPANFPRNLFIWRSNLLGSSGKGHEYMLKYLLGTKMAYWAMKPLPNYVRMKSIGSKTPLQANLTL